MQGRFEDGDNVKEDFHSRGTRPVELERLNI